MSKFIKVAISDHLIRWGTSDEVHFIKQSTLQHCNVEIRTPGKYLVISDSNFTDCTVVARPRLTAYQFHGARFYRTTFRGRFRHCDFGARKEDERWQFGVVAESSFQDAILDNCTLFGGGIESITWPAWPHFVVLEPLHHLKDWESTPFPPDANLSLAHIDSPEWPAGKDIRAVVFHLPSQWKSGDPEDIWSLIQDKPYVTFPHKELKKRVDAGTVQAIADTNKQARAEVEKQRDLILPWRGLYLAKLDALDVSAAGELHLRFDTRFLQRRLPDAPPAVILALHTDQEVIDALRARMQELGATKFLVRGLELDGDTVVLKGQRKALGTIRVPAGPVQFLLPDGSPLAAGALSDYQSRYWQMPDNDMEAARVNQG
jgi:hypothetical protein